MLPPSLWHDGPILAAVQQAGLFADSKDFVDSPLRVSPDEAWRRWKELPQPASDEQLSEFVASTFGAPGEGIEPWTPTDHEASPPLLARLPAGPARRWAAALNDMWPALGRQLSAEVRAHPERTTLLAVASRGFVVPGGRFRECYYWDSHWVVLGLLAVGMRQTAAGMVANLLDAARLCGHVPNGLRSYYLNRSQPPLLTQMVAALLPPSAASVGAEPAAAPLPTIGGVPLREALRVLDGEYAWWMARGEGRSAVLLPAADGRPAALLNRYAVRAAGPRPESWREDVALAAGLDGGGAAALFSELASAAESGWDFSSRWLLDGAELRSIRTSAVVPVELNAILYRNELALAALHTRCARRGEAEAEAAAHGEAATQYAAAAAARLAAMDAWLWDEGVGAWLDLLWEERRPLPGLSAASFAPLWAGAHSERQAAAATAALRSSGLLLPGGVAATLVTSGQQWDFPNAWPPLQQMLVEGLDQCGAEGAAELAAELAARWLRSNLEGWAARGAMHEKYDATRPGCCGGGGEYTAQVGFGWTNGAALWMLERYADHPLVRGLAAGGEAEGGAG